MVMLVPKKKDIELEALKPSDRITTPMAARYLSIDRTTLIAMKDAGTGPPFTQYGDAPNSPILYLVADLDAFIAERTYRSTAEQVDQASRRVMAARQAAAAKVSGQIDDA